MQEKQGMRETVVRGTPDFPFKLYHHIVDRVSVISHWHPEIELVYVVTGRFKVSIDNEEYSVRPGDIYMINSGELHTMTGDFGHAEFYSAVFYPEMLDFENKNPFQKKCLDLMRDGQIALPHRLQVRDKCYGEVREQFMRIITAEKKTFYRTLQLIAIYEMLFALLEGGGFVNGNSKKTKGAQSVSMLKSVTRYIDENYGEKITLSDLAQKVNVSEKYFCSFFKKYTGLTPIEYVLRVRVERACEKLKAGENVTETAFSCGFDSLSYFIRCFKKQTGKTPSDWRKENYKNS